MRPERSGRLLCSLAHWPGLTTKIQCWIMTIQFLFISRCSLLFFFYSAGCIHTHTKQHRRNSDLTKRKSRSTQIYTSPLSLAIVYCATDAQSFSFRSFLVVRRLIKKRKKIRTKRVDRSIFNDRILFFFLLFRWFHSRCDDYNVVSCTMCTRSTCANVFQKSIEKHHKNAPRHLFRPNYCPNAWRCHRWCCC